MFDRYALAEGDRLRDQAIIEEHESTAVVGPGAAIAVDESCNHGVKRARRKESLRHAGRQMTSRRQVVIERAPSCVTSIISPTPAAPVA